MQAAALTNSLNELIKESAEEVNRFGGYIVKGRVVVPDSRRDPRMVATQAYILIDGRFATVVANRAQPLRFRLIGYAPVDLDLTRFAPSSDPKVPVDLGDITMEPLDPRKSGTLSGKVSLSDGGDASIVRIEAFIAADPFNSKTGSVPRPAIFWNKIAIRVRGDGTFSAPNLTPSNYALTIKAKGYAGKTILTTVALGESPLPDPIVLDPATEVEFEYAVSDAPRFKGRPIKRGSAMTGEAWSSGSKAWDDLKLLQTGNVIEADEASRPSFLADLGKGALSDHVDLDGKAAKFTSLAEETVELHAGHVYLLEQRFLRHWVLFRVEFKKPRISASLKP